MLCSFMRHFSGFVLATASCFIFAVPIVLAQDPASEPSARLIVLVETKPYKSFLGDLYGSFYYQASEVECWLDEQPLYAGPVHKPGTITKIFDGLVEPGEHIFKIRWQARLRIIEGYKWDRENGQRIVKVPEEGFEQSGFVLTAGSMRVLKVIVHREAGIKASRSELIIRDVTEQIRAVSNRGGIDGTL